MSVGLYSLCRLPVCIPYQYMLKNHITYFMNLDLWHKKLQTPHIIKPSLSQNSCRAQAYLYIKGQRHTRRFRPTRCIIPLYQMEGDRQVPNRPTFCFECVYAGQTQMYCTQAYGFKTVKVLRNVYMLSPGRKRIHIGPYFKSVENNKLIVQNISYSGKIDKSSVSKTQIAKRQGNLNLLIKNHSLTQKELKIG